MVVRSYDAAVSEGNDALLKCSVSSELYEVVAWHTDDGEVYLPFGASTTCKWTLFFYLFFTFTFLKRSVGLEVVGKEKGQQQQRQKQKQ